MKDKSKLIIGTRGSDLALAQSRFVKNLIDALPNAPATEIVIIKTTGDRIQNVPLAEVASPGDERKGLFTKEIEDAMIAGEIDCAVHSFKDLPTQDPPGLKIVAVPERVSSRDVLIIPSSKLHGKSPPYLKPSSVIGTSSVRRIALIEYLWPEVYSVSLRGNVPTRIDKLRRGNAADYNSDEKIHVDAIMLAEAGLSRLMKEGLFDSGGEYDGLLDGLEIKPLEADEFIPAPAQGALAVQCRESDEEVKALLEEINLPAEAEGVAAERAVLSSLEGGCHLPLGVDCSLDENIYQLRCFLGQEAQNNRKNRSYVFSRRGSDAGLLAKRVISDIMEPMPAIITGREDRTRELLQRFSEKSLRALPLLEIEYLRPDEKSIDQLRVWCKSDEATNDDNGSGKEAKRIIAVFSSPGVAGFSRLLEAEGLKPPAVQWAVTGDKTEAELLKRFPEAKIAYRSPDGTGEALAKLIRHQKESIDNQLITIAAERGRPEFRDILAADGFDIIKLLLYRTVSRSPSDEELTGLPPKCNIVFGSPSAVEAFFASYERVYNNAKAKTGARYASGEYEKETAGIDHRFCALGPTTAKAVVARGVEVYAVARRPDYDAFIDEIL